MRKDDLYRQRIQQHTEGLALVGLEKGGLFVLKKTSGFALRKADWFVLRKTGFRLQKGGLFRFEKSGFVVLRMVGCVSRGAYATTRIGGSPM
jgi:hypothetical protein